MRNLHATVMAEAVVLAVSFVWTAVHGAEKPAEPVAITVTDKVLVEGVKRLGIKLCYIEFDRKVQPLKQNQIGILLELDRPKQGSIRDSNNPAHWNSVGNNRTIFRSTLEMD